MGGRGAKMSRRTNPYSSRPRTVAGGGATQAVSSGGGDVGMSLRSAAGAADFPEIASFSNKNIVDFNYKLDKSGTITIRDDRGRTYKGTYEGHGASRDTFGFKEGFVIKFDGLKPSFFGAGRQTKNEVEAYKNLNKALIRPAGKTPTGAARKAKYRVPNLISAHFDKTIKLPNGTTRRGVAIAIFSKAKGGHDTGIRADSKKGINLMKRANQYIRGLSRRGVSTGDFAVYTRNGTVRLHNIYRDRKTGKLTIVDLGL